MEDQDPIQQRRMSRRTMIKGTAGASVLMWAAPAVTTLGSHAAASQSLVPQCSSGATYECNGPIENCGTSGPLALCVCDETVDGQDFCWENYFCGDVETCTSDSDCESGFACVTNCCDDFVNSPTCAPACGTNLNINQRRVSGGPTATGS